MKLTQSSQQRRRCHRKSLLRDLRDRTELKGVDHGKGGGQGKRFASRNEAFEGMLGVVVLATYLPRGRELLLRKPSNQFSQAKREVGDLKSSPGNCLSFFALAEALLSPLISCLRKRLFLKQLRRSPLVLGVGLDLGP
jgi:hypothetical protein